MGAAPAAGRPAQVAGGYAGLRSSATSGTGVPGLERLAGAVAVRWGRIQALLLEQLEALVEALLAC